MLLHRNDDKKTKLNKSLSILLSSKSGKFVTYIPCKVQRAKALQYARQPGSFTLEAALVTPLIVLAAAIVLGLFPVMLVQTQITGALQYASRMVAVSCRSEEEDAHNLLYLAEGRIWFQSYLKEHGCRSDIIKGGTAGISMWESDFSGDYITLRASYRTRLPVSFWNISELPVKQSVRSRKWTGADPEEGTSAEDGYVYITPYGSAYHSSASCRYLDLSVRSASMIQIQVLRNSSGGIYYPCSCYRAGQPFAYITDYGTKYHSDLGCSDLKRTVSKVKREEAGSRHPCAKCYGGM